MSTQIAWHVPNQVLYIQLTGSITSDTLLKNAEFVAATLNNSTTYPIHVILDASRVNSLPKETGQLRNVLAPMLTHTKLGWTVVITGNLLLQTQLNRAAHRMTDKWGYVGSMREAADLLRRADMRLSLVPSSEPEGDLLFKAR
jgi:hypothetical protein